nr:hypothetical protein [Tanacetum cinerariifolium]
SFSSKDSPNDRFKPSREEEKKDAEDIGNDDNKVLSTYEPRVNQEKNANVNSTNNITTVSPTDNVVGIKDNAVDKDIVYGCVDDPNMPNFEEIVYSDDDKDVGADADMTNLDTNILVSPILTTRIHKDHPVKQIIRNIHSTPQTRRMTKYVTNRASVDIGGFTKWQEGHWNKMDLHKQVEGMFKHKEIYVTPSHTKKRKHKTKKLRRKDTELPQTSVPIKVVTDEAIYKEMHQETMRDAAAQTRVLTLETTKTNQALEIGSLKKVKNLKKKASKKTHKLNRLYKIGYSRRTESSNEASLGVLDDEVVIVEKEVSTADPITIIGVEVNAVAITLTISMDDITLAKALAALKSEKPKLKNKSFKEVQKAINNTMSWINSFVPMDKEVAEGSVSRADGSSKSAGEELDYNKSKKHKLDEKVEAEADNDQEEEEMKIYMKIVSDDV